MKLNSKLVKRSEVWFVLYVGDCLLGEFLKNRSGNWIFLPPSIWQNIEGDRGWNEQIVKLICKTFRQFKKSNVLDKANS